MLDWVNPETALRIPPPQLLLFLLPLLNAIYREKMALEWPRGQKHQKLL